MERTLAVALAAVAVLAVVLPGPAAVASRQPGEVAAGDAGAASATADVAAPGGAASGSGGSDAERTGRADTVNPVEMPNTTAKLVLPPDAASGAGVASQDLGAAIAAERRATTVSIGAMDLERRFEAAGSDEERRTVIRGELDRIGNRTRDLRAEERSAYRQYAAGNRSVRSLLVALARVDAEARLYRDRIRRLADLANEVSDISLRTTFDRQIIGRARSLDWQLETLSGPVRQHVARTYGGTADGGLVYVASAEEGVVLATMVDDTYAREALRADRFVRGPGHPFNLSDVVRSAYPWARTNNVVNPNFEGTVVNVGIWRLLIGHTQGRLRAYVDRSRESVFREVQRLQPARLPTAHTATAENDGLRVRVNQTFRGGPLNVTVVNNVTGQPVGSVVSVGDYRIGRTGPDGQLWTVAPSGPVTVTIRQGPNTVNVSVPAAEFPAAG